MNQKGASLLWAIAAIAVLGAVAAGLSVMTPATTQQVITDQSHLNSYYAALSGLNFARSLSDGNFQAILNGTLSDTYTINGNTFTLTVGAKNGSVYPVTSKGIARGGMWEEANYILGPVNVTPVANSIRPSASLTASVSGNGVKIAGTVDGTVIANSLTSQSGSSVTGSVILTSTTQDLSIHNGMTVATTSGSMLCSNYGITIDGGSNVINGNIYSPGDASSGGGYVKILAGSTVNGNIYANNTVTLDGNPKIYGQIHSQKDIQVEDATIGKASASQNMLCKLTPTVTGGEKIYTDINSQQGIILQNITIKGDLHYKTLLTTDTNRTHWTGSQDYNPTLPTAPISCPSNNTFTAPIFTATAAFTGTQNKTFTAGNYYYTSFTPNWSSNICFDTSGGDINILVSGDVEIQGSVTVKSKSSESCSRITLTSSAAIAAAPDIYMYTGGTFTLDGSVPWVGTVLANGNINPGSSTIVGSLHSINGDINPNQTWYNIKVIGLHE